MNEEQRIVDIVARQREFFITGATREYENRIDALKRLKAGLIKYETMLNAALKEDLNKSKFEAYLSETGFCLHELTETIKQLGKWMKPKRTRTSLLTQPGTSSIHYTPLGVNLIIAPFNYPIMLTFSPLTAAISAGNTAVVKTSETATASSAVIRDFINETFDPEYVAYVPGGVEETTILLNQKFDHIFFTGSARVGSIVMSAAARHLTPVTLELGGKSPCIVHHDANLDIAVNRITFGKFLNCGQTCIAPDYVLVHKDIKEDFLEKLKHRIFKCYGEEPSVSPDYGRIIDDNHFKRISEMIDPNRVVVGGQTDAAQRYIAPTVQRDMQLGDKAMREEIFGPVLPVLDYTRFDDIYTVIAKLPQHPLACYVFSESRQVQRELTANIQFGGGCINHCVLHSANSYLPFGGLGESGIGAYHGFHGFERFSHKKSVLKSATWVDLPLLYAPYLNKLKFLRRIMH
jgi:aldehyde dehydrogenase (NAD+)